MATKSEKLKKLEAELADLEHWLKLGLVPKGDLEKHNKEIDALRKKVDDEQKKIDALKESGEIEEYVTPKKQSTRTAYSESPTIPDTEMGEEPTTMTMMTAENEADTSSETITEEYDTAGETITEDEDPFSDRARWKRGMLHSDDDEW